MSDSFLVFYDFYILSMIKRKNPFGFYCVILILNLSRLISPITILISKVCRVWFLKCIFDFQNLTRLISQMTLLISKIYRVWFLKWHLISKIWHVWFLKWHFWFPQFIAFDFSNDTLHVAFGSSVLCSCLAAMSGQGIRENGTFCYGI